MKAHREGILTAASLMVAGEAFDEAVAMARQTPTLAVGLHVVLVDQKAVLPATALRGLVDANGWFPNAPTQLGLRYFFDPRARRRILAEIDAQFHRFAQTGLAMAHVDGHQHLHLHPAVFEHVANLARRHGAKTIRVPREELALAIRYDRTRLFTKFIRAAEFAGLSIHCRRVLRRQNRLAQRQGPIALPRVYGLMQSGRMDARYTQWLLPRIGAEAAEIYFHPTTGERLDAEGPNPEELAALLDPVVGQCLRVHRGSLGG